MAHLMAQPKQWLSPDTPASENTVSVVETRGPDLHLVSRARQLSSFPLHNCVKFLQVRATLPALKELFGIHDCQLLSAMHQNPHNGRT